MKKFFLTGLATLLPLTITLLLFYYIIDILTKPFVGLIKRIFHHFDPYIGKITHHPELLLWISRFTALILLVVCIFLLGLLVRKLFFNYLVELTHKVFERIPLVRSIYKTTKQISEMAFKEDQKIFKKSVLIKFPHSKATAMGLLAEEAPECVKLALSDEELKTIFVPTSPHPISGFLLICQNRDIKEIDISTEDVFKFLISCGIYQPKAED